MNGANAAGEQVRDTQNLDLFQTARGFRERHGIGGNNFGDFRVFEALNSGPRKDSVSAGGINLNGTFANQGVSGFHESARGVDNVVHDESGAALDVADKVHDFGDVEIDAALIDDGERRIEFFGEGAGALHAAGIGRNHGE